MPWDQLYAPVLIGIYGAALLTFVLLFLVTAPYGRYVRKGWGLSMAPRLAWLVMELPAVVVIALAALGARGTGPLPIVFLAYWELHYLYRTFAFPALMRESPKRRFPILLMLMAILFNTANGFVNGWYLFHLEGGMADRSLTWLGDPRFILGSVLFFAGLVIHIHSDTLLRRLRGPGDTDYKIPSGGLFRWVSCPNYFGEILQWSGFALATWSLPGLAFAVFTTANLLPRGISHHRWYRKTFPDYPKGRKAVVPVLL